MILSYTSIQKKIFKIFAIKKVGYVVRNKEGETFYFQRNEIIPTSETTAKATHLHITPQ